MIDIQPLPDIMEHQVCYVQAAQAYRLPLVVLPAIASIEGGKTGLSSPNANGTFDHGLMQINSSWLTRFRDSFKIAPELVKNDPCVSILMAGYIVRYEIDHANGNFWVGVGRYHSRTPVYHVKYVKRVHEAALKLQPQIQSLEDAMAQRVLLLATN